MAINIKVVRLQAPATNTTQDYTVASNGAAQAVMVMSGVAGDGSDANELMQSIGFWDTTNTVCYNTYAEHAASTATFDSNSGQSSSDIVQIRSSATDDRKATISAITDGIRLTWAGATTSVRPWTIVILINGINGAQAGAATPHATDANTQQETTTGITPKVIFAGQNRSNVADSRSANKAMSFGFAYDTGSGFDQKCFGWKNIEANNQHYAYVWSDRISMNWGNTSIDTFQTITAMASGSFTQTTNNTAGAADSDLYYLALDFNEDAAIFQATTPTTAVDFVPLTGGSFTPASCILIPTFMTTLDTRSFINESGFMGIYVADGSNGYQVGWCEEDATSTSNTSGRSDDVLFNQDDVAGTPDFLSSTDGSLPVFASGSITFDKDDTGYSAGSQASYVLGIAFAEGSGQSVVPILSHNYSRFTGGLG